MAQFGKLRLVANAATVHTQKILVAAKAAGIEVKLEIAKAAGANPELHGGNRIVRYTGAILRYMARALDGTDLYGTSFHESAQVDSWLDWVEMELTDASESQVQDAIRLLEKHLDNRVFLVGQRFTIADVSLGCALHDFQRRGIAAQLPRATARYFNTCAAQDSFTAVLGGASPAAGGSEVTRATGSAAVASATSSAPRSLPMAFAETSCQARYSTAVGNRTRVSHILAAPDKGESLIGQIVSVCGWVKTKREGNKGKLVFLDLTDGSCVAGLQVVVDAAAKGFETLKENFGTGASVRCTGEVVASPAKGQKVELLVAKDGHEVSVFGTVDAKTYPLSKKEHSSEFLREIAHLRPRSNFIGAVARVRSALAFAVHEFFRSKGFQYVHTPLITAADCEGAGEMFQVTTLLGEKDGKLDLPMKDGKPDYTQDFFGKPAFMTVSGQLSVENYACALSNVYTFGPTFRAENSHTNRHLAEFWMIEPELAWADLFDDMDCAEDFLKYCIGFVLEHHRADLDFFEEKCSKGLIQKLHNILKEPFARITYTDAIEVLKEEAKKTPFSVEVEWGIDLGSELERHLSENVMKRPTIVYNYPKEMKAFYMRLNDDGKTVGAMDILAPFEVIGGSQREERLEVLDRRIGELGLNPQDYWWYRDLRRFGSVPHSGFGLGFERLIMLCTGVENIRDTIPYPRYPGHAEF